ncbi:MAG: signal peptide peptidase SppA [Bacteroidota bacterium]
MAFLRNLLATLTGLVLFSIVGILILFGIVASASQEETPDVKNNTILSFEMSGVLVDKAVDDPFLKAIGNSPKQHSLLDIIASIKAAKTDSRIEGIYIKPMFLSAGYASLQEIRDALLDFKASGKFVYAYGEYVSESDYYVSSVADSLFINPTGSMEFNGLSANITFFKGLFEKLDIEPQVFRVGEFKSFVEPFIRKDMSEENKLQYNELLASMYGTYLTNVSLNLDKTVEELSEVSNTMKVRLPKDALANGLVHKVGYEDEIKRAIRNRMGLTEDAKLKFMSLSTYHQVLKSESKYSKNKVAVIVAEGNIVMGGDEGIVGETFAKEVRKARESKSVKAIVLRVNSGGGSMTASDMIWRELMLTKGEKPIVASMGNAAASGGYYIAMPADEIIAQPNTITGSIGIFGLWFNFSKFLENKVGITHDVVKTGEYSDIYTVTRQLNDQEKAIIQSTVDEGYEVFTQKVAENRGMTQERVKEVGGGRVWSGEQALEKGLVDQLGSFNDAVELAAEKAGIADDYRVSYYPKKKPFIEEFLEKMSSRIRTAIVGTEVDPYIQQIESVKQLEGIQARLPGELEIK